MKPHVAPHDETDDDVASRFPAIVSLVMILHIGAGSLMPGAMGHAPRESFESQIVLEAPPPEPPPPPPPPPVDEPAPPKPVAVVRAAPKPAVLETSTSASDVKVDAVVAETVSMPATPPPPTEPAPIVAAPPAPAAPPRVDPGPPLVPAKSLGRMPRAPALDRELERNYPADARRAGISGSATLRLQVMPDGRLGRVQQVSESHPGFGPACERTVRAARWDPPLDREGHAVATEIKYVCKFEVRS
jgi:protein TonB